METFSALLALCAGNSPITGEFSPQRLVARSFEVFLDLRLNKQVNNRDAGDLRRHQGHYDVTVMTGMKIGDSLPICNNIQSVLCCLAHLAQIMS